MSESVRFIIITVPPTDVSARIDAARRAVAALTGSVSALAYPPHVTLRTGVRVPAAALPQFLDDFKRVVGEWRPFPVSTDGFLRTTYESESAVQWLIGYRIRKDEALSALNRRLLSYVPFRVSDRLDFRPHLTLAFEDLTMEAFFRAGRYMEKRPPEIPETFQWECDNVGLYRLEDGLWTPYVVFRQEPGKASAA